MKKYIFGLSLILFSSLFSFNCKEEVNPSVTDLLTNSSWGKPIWISTPGSTSGVICINEFIENKFSSDGDFYSKRENCGNFGYFYSGQWEWIIEEEKLFIDFENIEDKFMEVV